MSISQITPNLFITAHPNTSDIKEINKLNISLIINAIFFPLPQKAIRKSNIEILSVPSIDSKYTPIPMYVFRKSIIKAVPLIKSGKNVLIYCKQGRHRSVAIATCILIALGYSIEDAMDLIVQKRPIADPYEPYIKKRIMKFEKLVREGLVQY